MCRAASFTDQISLKLFGALSTVPGPFGMEVAAHAVLRSFGLPRGRGERLLNCVYLDPRIFFASFLPFLSRPTGAERQSRRPGPAPRSHLPSACAAVGRARSPRAGDVQKASGYDRRSYNHPSGTDLWLIMRLECVTRRTQPSKAPCLR